MKPRRRKPRNLEHLIQCSVIQQCRLMERKYSELRLLYAIPNGGQRHPAVAAKLKAGGVRAGVPDLCLPLPIRGSFSGLYIEMKSPDGAVSTSQKDFMELLQWAGYKAVICYSAQAAVDTIIGHIVRARSAKKVTNTDEEYSAFMRPQID